MFKIFLSLLLLASCSTKRTQYGKYSKKTGGYQDKVIEGNLRMVSFRANSQTKVDLARKFAAFRAIEICTEQKAKLTHILGVFDKTQSKTVTRTSGSGYPSYSYGMSPFYGRHSGVGFGFGTMSSSSWNETLKIPDIEVMFECAENVYEPTLVMREVPAEEMKHLVKDLKGGLQIEKISDTLNNDFKVGDILILASDERVQHHYQLLSLFHKSRGKPLSVQLLRDGKREKGFSLKGIDVSEKVMDEQKRLIHMVCQKEEVKANPLCPGKIK